MNAHILNTTEISFPLFGESFSIDAPSYISIFGFNVYLYALCITAGFCFAALYVIKRREALGLTWDNILDLVIMAVPFGLIGARIFYIVFNPGQYIGSGNWQNIFALREGGLAVYGGIIGAGIAFVVYGKIKKIHIGKLVDAAAFGLFIGQSIGRWGNFFNREAFGVETDLPWRMGLMTSSGISYVHPAFLYESLWNILGLVFLHVFSKIRKSGFPGQYFLIYVAWYGFGRFFIEGIRADSLYIHNTDLRVSQLIAALSFAAAVIVLARCAVKGKALGEATTDQPLPAEGGSEGAEPIEAAGEALQNDAGASTDNEEPGVEAAESGEDASNGDLA